MALINGTDGNDSLVGGVGNDTIDGGAGYNLVEYAGSEYDYIVTRLDDGSITVRAIAGTPFANDGTDSLFNIQRIKFLDGNTERILDDVANINNLLYGTPRWRSAAARPAPTSPTCWAPSRSTWANRSTPRRPGSLWTAPKPPTWAARRCTCPAKRASP